MEIELILNDIKKQLVKEKSLQARILLEKIIEDFLKYQRLKDEHMLNKMENK